VLIAEQRVLRKSKGFALSLRAEGEAIPSRNPKFTGAKGPRILGSKGSSEMLPKGFKGSRILGFE
jgi:hypothetical protein